MEDYGKSQEKQATKGYSVTEAAVSEEEEDGSNRKRKIAAMQCQWKQEYVKMEWYCLEILFNLQPSRCK